MRKSLCNFVKWVTFGKVCLGWCVIPKEDTTPTPEVSKEDTTPTPKRLSYTKRGQ